MTHICTRCGSRDTGTAHVCGYDQPNVWTKPRATTSANPYKCPVCDGTGLVSRPPGVAGDQASFVSNSSGPWPCRACGGVGVIWAPASDGDSAL